MHTTSRRDFVVALAAAGGGLLIGCRVDGRRRIPGTTEASAADSSAFAPDAWVRVGTDGRVTVVVSQVEMGQGVYTSMPMLVAEELEVPLDQVQAAHAPPDDKLYANPLLGFQVTGASSSVRALYTPLRKAGATARAMLIAAAAQRWNVDPAACTAENGTVTHAGKKLSYGELADAAAKLPVPTEVKLKDPKDFKLIGTPAKRIDTPEKVNGTAKYSIDVRLPGLKIATLAASPVVGGKVASVDDTKAKTIPGVRQIVKLDDLVAVVGDHMWAAKQGLAALVIRWDDGPNGKVSTEDVVKGLDAASRKPGVVARKQTLPYGASATGMRKIEAVYQVPFLAHATMEPVNCTVHVRKDGCEVWTRSQVLTRVQATAAKVTGLPPEKVVVHNHLLGGGFGRSLEVDCETKAIRIAKEVEGPVKVVYTREEDMQHDVYRPYYYGSVPRPLNAEGKPVAWNHRIVGRRSSPAGLLPPSRTGSMAMRWTAQSNWSTTSPRSRSSTSATRSRCSTSGSGAAWDDPQQLRDRELHG